MPLLELGRQGGMDGSVGRRKNGQAARRARGQQVMRELLFKSGNCVFAPGISNGLKRYAKLCRNLFIWQFSQ